MLTLSRKVGEIIEVGDAALVVLEMSGGQVKLGLQFPRDVRIVRGELVTPNDAARYCMETVLLRDERKAESRERWRRSEIERRKGRDARP
jgi:carbon storage regulator CsrA